MKTRLISSAFSSISTTLLAGAGFVGMQDAGVPVPQPPQIPATVSASTVLPWLVAGGLLTIVGLANTILKAFFDAWIYGSKRIREANAGTDHESFVKCEEKLKAMKDCSDLLTTSVETLKSIIAERDRQLEAAGRRETQAATTLAIYMENYNRLAVAAATTTQKRKISPLVPTPVSIVQTKDESIQVHDVGKEHP